MTGPPDQKEVCAFIREGKNRMETETKDNSQK